MNSKEFLEILNKGEGYHVEFKLEEENNEDFAKTIVCFANTDGGKILIGVDDSCKIIGVSDIDKVMFRMDDIALYRCEPPVMILQESISIEGKNVVIVNVEKETQSILVIAGELGWKKTLTYVGLVVVMSTIAGLIFGMIA